MSSSQKRKQEASSSSTMTDWKLCRSERNGGREYWHNEVTGESSWTDPTSNTSTPLEIAQQSVSPVGQAVWEKHWSKTHQKFYYFDKVSGVTKWDSTDSSPIDSIQTLIDRESNEHAVDAPGFPRCVVCVRVFT